MSAKSKLQITKPRTGIKFHSFACFLGGGVAGFLLHSLVGGNGWGQFSLVTKQSTINGVERGDAAVAAAAAAAAADLPPLHRSSKVEPFETLSRELDAFNPIYQYLKIFDTQKTDPMRADFPELPLWHTWLHYPEAYHNHFSRFRGRKKVIFMEVGVQSGGKIPMLRDYFGPGFEYIGIDINPSTKKFESADWIHIEIGNSGDRNFWKDVIIEKYPIVDIFLDDGGHFMDQQKVAMEMMLPHVQPDGVFMCEDIATSWSRGFGGIRGGTALNTDFVKTTMQGLVLQSLDWLNSGFVFGAWNGVNWDSNAVPADGFGVDWWNVVTSQVKHIHYYNQLVVYEKGLTFAPVDVKTVGTSIPYRNSGTHERVDWDFVMKKVRSFTKSKWDW